MQMFQDSKQQLIALGSEDVKISWPGHFKFVDPEQHILKTLPKAVTYIMDFHVQGGMICTNSDYSLTLTVTFGV